MRLLIYKLILLSSLFLNGCTTSISPSDNLQSQKDTTSKSLASDCFGLTHMTQNQAHFKNNCGERMYFLWDGGGIFLNIVGTNKGGFPAGFNPSFDITGKKFYWRFCTLKEASETNFTCSKSKLHKKTNHNDYEVKHNCIEPIWTDWIKGDGKKFRDIKGLKNICKINLTVTLRDTEHSLNCVYFNSEGTENHCSGKMLKFRMSKKSEYLFSSEYKTKQPTRSLAQYQSTGNYEWGACNGSTEIGTFPHWTKAGIFDCSISDRGFGDFRRNVPSI